MNVTSPRSWTLVLPPVIAAAAVAVGLRLGAPRAGIPAALVYGAAASGQGLAWQIVAFEEDGASREPMAGADLAVTARAGGREARWQGTTDPDGVAEALLPLPGPDGLWLEVRRGDVLLAGGDATTPATIPPREPPAAAWMPFARRDGAIVIDVAVLGQRVAPGFPAVLLVHATDAVTREPVTSASVELESDPSLLPGGRGQTDSRGWAQLVTTPVGLAVSAAVRARSPDGRAGQWTGGLFVSPGAAEVRTRLRWASDEEPVFELIAPTPRAIAYVEVDDAQGRVWAAAVPLAGAPGALPTASARAPRLSAGLYWVVCSSDAAGAARLGPGTAARPFFVAPNDEAALSFGTDPLGCAAPGDPRELPAALASCLALARAAPVARWTALDGSSMQQARDRARRSRGLAVAVGAVVLAALLELMLLLRAAAASRQRLRAEVDPDGAPSALARAWSVGAALLVALLGFALLAAFLTRV